MSGYLPSKDSALVNWANNFSTLVSASPTTYGLSATTATALASLTTAYASAYADAIHPSTRGKSTIIAKNTAKRDLIAFVRPTVKTIQGVHTLTPQQKSDLGITVGGATPTPRPVPQYAPGITIASVYQKMVTIRLHDTENPDRRGKPANVAGAQIYSYIGEHPPVGIDGWKFEGSISRVEIPVEFDNSVPNFATVWFTAVWFNARQETGPMTNPVFTNLGKGLGMAA